MKQYLNAYIYWVKDLGKRYPIFGVILQQKYVHTALPGVAQVVEVTR